MSLLLLLPSVAGPPPPTWPPNIPLVTFAGATVRIKYGTLDISELANGRNTMSCELDSSGAYRPAIDDPVAVTVNSTLIFAGAIDSTTERGAGDVPRSQLAIRVNVKDYNVLPDRRYVNTTFATGTLKSMLTTLVTYLSPFGVTLDPAQVNGPILEAQTYDYKQATEILNDWSTRTKAAGAEYVWEIDYSKVLRMYSAGTVAAPFNVVTGNGNAIGDIQVDQHARTDYANQIILRYGSSSIVEQTDTFTGNGFSTSFGPLTYTPLGFRGYIRNGTDPSTGVPINEPLGNYWVYDDVTNTIGRYAPPTNGNLITVTYDTQFPQTVLAADAAGQATYGILEKLVEYPDVYDKAAAQSYADAELSKALERLTTCRYATRGLGLKPGQIQTITVATRNVNASYLITDIRTRDDPDGQLRRHVTAVQGTTLRPTPWDTYKTWGGSSGSSSTVFTGGGVASVPAVTWSRPAYFLGGSSVEYVQSPTPTWVDASAVEVVLDTTSRGITVATVTGRLRATAGSVTARLQNVTDGVTAGTSSAVTSTTWTAMSFSCTLTPGSRAYRLQVLPSLSDTDVSAIGSVE